MSIEQVIVETLGELGLSINAAKTYIALLKNNPATGYEVSNRAGIPRSAIYSVLNKLESMNIINGVGESPRRYVPLSPSSLLEHLNRLNSDRLESLKRALDSVELEQEAFDFWHIAGYKDLILRLKEEIVKAQKTIFLGIWCKEYNALRQEIYEVSKRDLNVIIFSFCDIPKDVGSVICYGIDEDKLQKIWNPKVILVADQTITIMGRALDTPDNKAIWTNNEAITEIAKNHIVLDITLAGQRLGIDVNPIVQKMMRRADLHLDELLEKQSGRGSSE